jgi:hypothetical protein
VLRGGRINDFEPPSKAPADSSPSEGSNSVIEKVIGPETRSVDEIYVRMPTPDETRRLKLTSRNRPAPTQFNAVTDDLARWGLCGSPEGGRGDATRPIAALVPVGLAVPETCPPGEGTDC